MDNFILTQAQQIERARKLSDLELVIGSCQLYLIMGEYPGDREVFEIYKSELLSRLSRLEADELKRRKNEVGTYKIFRYFCSVGQKTTTQR